jgi:glycerol uptake facilitator-like aquaporin
MSATSATSPAAPTEAGAAAPAAEQDSAIKQVLGKGLDVLNDVITVPDWVALHPLLAHYFAEACGTFLFVLTIALVGLNDPVMEGHPETNMQPIPIGFMLMCMVFTFGYISGGHFNPSVTFAVWLVKRDERVRTVGYIVCQCGAAFGAGIVAMIIEGNTNLIAPSISTNSAAYIRRGIFAELVYSFALALVVLNVAYSRQRANFFYGFSIGFVIVAGISAVGSVSGGAFNPAVATGLQAAKCFTGNCGDILFVWVYWLAPMIGAGLAALLFINMESAHEGQQQMIV